MDLLSSESELRLSCSSTSKFPRLILADDDSERINLQPINSFSPNRMKEALAGRLLCERKDEMS